MKRNEIRLQNDAKKWDQRLNSLHLAIKYEETNKEEDMKSKIAQWRIYAQEAAMALLPYYQEQIKNISAFNDYGDGFDNGNSEQVQRGKNADSDSTTGNDDMSTMLIALGIDPDTLHYSSELGEFIS